MPIRLSKMQIKKKINNEVKKALLAIVQLRVIASVLDDEIPIDEGIMFESVDRLTDDINYRIDVLKKEIINMYRHL